MLSSNKMSLAIISLHELATVQQAILRRFISTTAASLPGKKRCAIIGAGGSGVPAARWAKQYGHEPVVFERTNEVGGMWNYKPYDTDLASVMKSTVINTSKEMTAYSDFPPPAEFGNFMHNRQLHKYFKLYANHHDLVKHIKFEHNVNLVERAPDYETTGKWIVHYTDAKGNTFKEEFESVLMCTGHHAKPQMPPAWPGQEKFKGRIIHSHDYKDSKGFEDSVTVVTYLSTRRGAWVLYKVGKYGVPFDFSINRRLTCYLRNIMPQTMLDSMIQSDLNRRFDHTKYSLKPKHSVTSQHPTINEEMSNRLISGLMKIKPNIKEFTEHGVIWEDGTTTEHVDNVVLSTGYYFGFPLLEKGQLIPVQNNEVSNMLYKYMYPIKLSKHNTMGIIGLFQPVGSIMPIAEMQSRVFFDVLDGRTKLPSKEHMLKEMIQKREENKKRYVDSLRHTIQVDYVEFMDELGDMIGCTARPLKLLTKNPRLALRSIFGQVSSYQYRIFGPHPWDKAIEAALTVDERVEKCTKTRKVD